MVIVDKGTILKGKQTLASFRVTCRELWFFQMQNWLILLEELDQNIYIYIYIYIYKLLQHEPITNTTYCGAHLLMVKTKEVIKELHIIKLDLLLSICKW